MKYDLKREVFASDIDDIQYKLFNYLYSEFKFMNNIFFYTERTLMSQDKPLDLNDYDGFEKGEKIFCFISTSDSIKSSKGVLITTKSLIIKKGSFSKPVKHYLSDITPENIIIKPDDRLLTILDTGFDLKMSEPLFFHLYTTLYSFFEDYQEYLERQKRIEEDKQYWFIKVKNKNDDFTYGPYLKNEISRYISNLSLTQYSPEIYQEGSDKTFKLNEI